MQSTSQIRVRYAETDQMGVAYHANYLVWCEVGRTEFIRQLGVSYAEMEAAGVKLAVADAHLRYRAAARYDDEITITTRLTSARSRMVAFAYRLTRRRPDGGEELVADATTDLVSIDGQSRPITIPATFRARLEAVVSSFP
ncbi:MAG: thioesterase family protein [Gemmatimonadota bacterium]|jgi:acyl-CoA thioester hydrolase|nr:acyl-CoA thioesterase [Gemmatimonadota bacterium]MDQ8151393.1 thioesterase family protein [Gemmatimonadota bacterium]MDQ8152986.1 thioesterase family protein [Gemmatimonadota bacterium]MDQ8173977.1 thioesterase family protein [Gemmatimonadota bacterium]MDQ8178934.1 thioesterase family protein [Gemmatimonadota bacterium]